VLLFFPSPLEAQPHDVDVKAPLRLVLVYDIPAAISPRTATALAQSGLVDR
jgi:methylglyoxal synthase